MALVVAYDFSSHLLTTCSNSRKVLIIILT